VLAKIFTWWSGATLGALFTIAKRATFVGEDSFGNRYFEARDTRDSYDGRKRRWVTYKGYADASKIPPDWHGWIHHTFDEPPTVAPFKLKAWEKDHLPNLTGTPYAYRPTGAISMGGDRQPAAGDYQPWRPE
jgi:NADH:ubiquinone oxidoreductase subunit